MSSPALKISRTAASLSESEIATLYSFFLVLSPTGIIEKTGPGYRKHFPDITPGMPFDDCFEQHSPKILAKEFVNRLKRSQGELFLIAKRGTAFQLKGQILFQESPEQFLLLLSPHISELSQVSEFGLTFNDFPPGESVIDFLLLLQAQKRIQQDLEEAQKKTAQIAKLPQQNPNPILQFDQRGKLIYSNPSASKLWAELQEKQGQAAIENLQAECSLAFRNKTKHECELSLGSSHYLCLFVPFTEEGTINVYCAEITEKKRLEQELRKINKRYQGLVGSMKATVFQTDTGGLITYVNPAWEEMSGFSESETLGKPLSDFIYAGDLQNHNSQLFALSPLETDFARYTIRIVARNGSIRWSEVFARLTLSHAGKITGITGTIGDIHEQKIAQEKIAESESRYRFLAENSLDMIVRHGLDGRYLYVSNACQRILGYQSEELIGQQPMDFCHPEDQEKFDRYQIEILRGALNKTLTFRFRKKDGSYAWLESTAHAVMDSYSQKPIEVLSTSRDVTERLRAQAESERFFAVSLDMLAVMGVDGKFHRVNPAFEKGLGYSFAELEQKGFMGLVVPEERDAMATQLNELRQTRSAVQMECQVQHRIGELRTLSLIANLAAEDSQVYCGIRDVTDLRKSELKLVQASKMSTLGEMAGGIAHEINNPLAIISGKAHQLKSQLMRNGLDPESGIRNLEKIEATALRISKIIRGLRSFSRNSDHDPFIPTPLNSIIEDTLELCRERFKNHSIELRVSEIPDLSFSCRSAQISQVLLNLLNNAHDAIETKDEKWVALEIFHDAETLTVQVTDSGNGIPPAVVEKMMQPFFTTKEVGKGTGLGLSISKGIIEEHGGTLSLDSECPNTRFIVQIPLKSAAKNEQASTAGLDPVTQATLKQYDVDSHQKS